MSLRTRIAIALSVSSLFCFSFLFSPGNSLWIIKSLGAVTLCVNTLFLLWEFFLWKFAFWSRYTSSPPFLKGTWKGVLRSSYKDPTTGLVTAPIEVFLVIDQKSDSVTNVSFYSEESYSSSITFPALAKDGEQWKFSYVYQNSPAYMLREKSPVHDGTVLLNVDNGKHKSLKGRYWTDRCTRGELEFTHYSKARAVSFDKAKELFSGE